MDNEQMYHGLLETITRQMVPKVAEVGSTPELKGRLQTIVNDCRRIIDADRDDSDYEHMWSSEAVGAFEREFVPSLILRLAEKLEGLDLYSTEALEVMQRQTYYPEGGRILTGGPDGPYRRLQNELRENILDYLLTNARTDEERSKVRALERNEFPE